MAKSKDSVETARSIFNKFLAKHDPQAEDVKREDTEQPEKNPVAVAAGKLGGLKGGKARAAKLSAKKRSAIAKKAAQARWKS